MPGDVAANWRLASPIAPRRAVAYPVRMSILKKLGIEVKSVQGGGARVTTDVLGDVACELDEAGGLSSIPLS